LGGKAGVSGVPRSNWQNRNPSSWWTRREIQDQRYEEKKKTPDGKAKEKKKRRGARKFATRPEIRLCPTGGNLLESKDSRIKYSMLLLKTLTKKKFAIGKSRSRVNQGRGMKKKKKGSTWNA